MAKYYLYILHSSKTNRYYIGHTNNFERRLEEHNSRQTKSTRSGIPWEPRLVLEYTTKSEAHTLEKKLKSMKSRKYIEEFIEAAR